MVDAQVQAKIDEVEKALEELDVEVSDAVNRLAELVTKRNALEYYLGSLCNKARKGGVE